MNPRQQRLLFLLLRSRGQHVVKGCQLSECLPSRPPPITYNQIIIKIYISFMLHSMNICSKSWENGNSLSVSLFVHHLSHTTKLSSKCKSFIPHNMNIYSTSWENVNSLGVSLFVRHLSHSKYVTHILRSRCTFTLYLTREVGGWGRVPFSRI